MNKKLLAALEAKFNGVDAAILTRIAEKKAAGVTDESQITAIVEGITFQDVLNSYGDYRANGATATAVLNYEKKHALKDGKPIETPPIPNEPKPNPAPNAADVPEWAKSLIESNNALSAKLAAIDAERAKQTRADEIAARAKEYGIPDQLVAMLHVPDDADVADFMKEAGQKFVDLGFSGVKPPETGGGMKDDASTLAERIAAGTKQITESKK